MKVYVLRNCRSDMTSYNDFVWPESGFVECPDWDSAPKCGNGLHGFLWGKGNPSLLYSGDCKYLIVEVDSNLIVDLGDKVKFPQGNVVFCTSDKYAAGVKMIEFGADPATCMFSQVTTGDGGTSVTGYRGNSTSGDHGNSTSGYWGTSTSGYWGTSTSGNQGTSTSGNQGTSTSGFEGISTSGDSGKSISGYHGNSTSGYWGNSTSGTYGTSISGNAGTSISGDCGTSISGSYGTSTSGTYGTSTSGNWGNSVSGYGGNSISGTAGTSASGYRGTVQTGKNGQCILTHWTEKTGFTEKVLNDPKPNVKYQLNDNGEFVEVS